MAYDIVPKLNFTPYVQPYVGSTNVEQEKLLNRLDETYKQNTGTLDAIEQIKANFKANPGDQQYAKEHLDNVGKQINSIVESGDYMNSTAIKGTFKGLTNNPILIGIADNYKRREEVEAEKKKILADPKNGGVQMLGDNPDTQSSIVVDSEGTQTIRPLNAYVAAKGDFIRQADELLAPKLKDLNDYSIKSMRRVIVNGKEKYIATTTAGVDIDIDDDTPEGNKLREQFEPSVDEFLQFTGAGQLMAQASPGANANEFSDTARNQARQLLLSRVYTTFKGAEEPTNSVSGGAYSVGIDPINTPKLKSPVMVEVVVGRGNFIGDEGAKIQSLQDVESLTKSQRDVERVNIDGYRKELTDGYISGKLTDVEIAPTPQSSNLEAPKLMLYKGTGADRKVITKADVDNGSDDLKAAYRAVQTRNLEIQVNRGQLNSLENLQVVGMTNAGFDFNKPIYQQVEGKILTSAKNNLYDYLSSAGKEFINRVINTVSPDKKIEDLNGLRHLINTNPEIVLNALTKITNDESIENRLQSKGEFMTMLSNIPFLGAAGKAIGHAETKVAYEAGQLFNSTLKNSSRYKTYEKGINDHLQATHTVNANLYALPAEVATHPELISKAFGVQSNLYNADSEERINEDDYKYITGLPSADIEKAHKEMATYFDSDTGHWVGYLTFKGYGKEQADMHFTLRGLKGLNEIMTKTYDTAEVNVTTALNKLTPTLNANTTTVWEGIHGTEAGTTGEHTLVKQITKASAIENKEGLFENSKVLYSEEFNKVMGGKTAFHATSDVGMVDFKDDLDYIATLPEGQRQSMYEKLKASAPIMGIRMITDPVKVSNIFGKALTAYEATSPEVLKSSREMVDAGPKDLQDVNKYSKIFTKNAGNVKEAINYKYPVSATLQSKTPVTLNNPYIQDATINTKDLQTFLTVQAPAIVKASTWAESGYNTKAVGIDKDPKDVGYGAGQETEGSARATVEGVPPNPAKYTMEQYSVRTLAWYLVGLKRSGGSLAAAAAGYNMGWGNFKSQADHTNNDLSKFKFTKGNAYKHSLKVTYAYNKILKGGEPDNTEFEKIYANIIKK